ncbi:MAG: hypothetical protein ACQETL_19580 [Bacteroidota bacterium]
MEYKNLENDSLVALPENSYKSAMDNIFDIAGTLEGITEDDFRKHTDFSHLHLPLYILGSLSCPNPKASEVINNTLEQLCENPLFNEKLLKDDLIKSILSEYEVVEGHIFVIRFAGKHKETGDKVARSEAYLVNRTDGEISIESNKCTLNNPLGGSQEIALKQVPLDFQAYNETQIESFNAGSVKVHRKVIKPFLPESGHLSHNPGILNLKKSTKFT